LVLAGLVLVLTAAVVPLSMLVGHDVVTQSLQSYGVVPVAAVALIIAWRRPGNPIGWLLLLIAVFDLLQTDGPLYALGRYRLGRHLPLGAVALLLSQSWLPALVLFPLVILLFPDGRPPPGRWRWALRTYIAVGIGFTAVITTNASVAIAEGNTRVDAAGQMRIFDHGAGYGGTGVAVVFVVSFAGFFVAAVGYQVVSWRQSSGERRQQLKWFASGTLISFVTVFTALPLSSAHGIWHAAGDVLVLGLAAAPVCMGVGILRYRLYEIDRIISRTLAYAIVTGVLVGVYAGLVLLASHVLPLTTPVAVAASTLAAAALFSPLRRRVQRVVDRRFNRARYDADRTVAAFAGRLKDAVDLDSVRDDLASAVREVLEPAHVSVWVSERGR
jgi:hypothetical protein